MTATAPTAPTAHQLLTMEEVSEMIRVPVNTLRYWRHKGIGPKSARLGRVMYRLTDVEAWINAAFENGEAK